MSDRKSVLVVNDDETQRNNIRKIIQGLCDVDAPASHAELLERLAAIASDPRAYAVVILDHVLEFWNPQQSPRTGEEVVQMLRPTGKERIPPIIFLTNLPDSALRKRMEQKYGVTVAFAGEITQMDLYQAVQDRLQQS